MTNLPVSIKKYRNAVVAKRNEMSFDKIKVSEVQMKESRSDIEME